MSSRVDCILNARGARHAGGRISTRRYPDQATVRLRRGADALQRHDPGVPARGSASKPSRRIEPPDRFPRPPSRPAFRTGGWRRRAFTISLCRRPSFHMAPLHAPALARRPDENGRNGRIQERAVIRSSLRARTRGRTSALEANFRLPTPGVAVRVAMAIVILGVAGLFLGWLLSFGSGEPAIEGLGPQLDCTSMGRAGDHCVRRAASDDRPGAGASAEEQCPSLGRAGRVCAPHRPDGRDANQPI